MGNINYAWWLACLHEVKRRHRLSFLQKYGTAQALFRMAEEDLLMCGCFTPEEVTGIIRARNPDKLKREQEYFQKKGIRFAG